MNDKDRAQSLPEEKPRARTMTKGIDGRDQPSPEELAEQIERERGLATPRPDGLF
jgi:hypothetical protein